MELCIFSFTLRNERNVSNGFMRCRTVTIEETQIKIRLTNNKKETILKEIQKFIIILI